MIRFAIDPVCEMEIRPERAAAVATFEGHRIYFCSQTCYGEFLDIPHSYVGWDEAPDQRRGRPPFRLDLGRLLAAGRRPGRKPPPATVP